MDRSLTTSHTSTEPGRPDTALFDGLDAGALEEVSRQMRLRHFAAGEILCRAGEPGDSLFVIRRGLVHVIAGQPAHDATRQEAVLGRQRPGDVVGEVALLTGEPRSATLIARMPTDVLELGREAFLTLAARFPVLLANLAGIVSRRLVARTAGAARRRRPEPVAVVAGPQALRRMSDIVAATRAASPRPVAAIDVTGAKGDPPATSQVLERLELSLRDHGTVLTIVRPDHQDLPVLLDYMDRVVAVMSYDDGRALADSVGLVAGRLELVELDATAGRPSGGSEPVRAVRRMSRELGAADLDWLGRHLARTKLGVELGAGGAKGFAHVGVLRALEQAGYTVDRVAGSSIGAWVGAWLALGMDADAIEHTLRDRFTPDVVEALFRRGAAGEPSGVEVMARLARETTGERTFEQLEIPLVAMTADLHGRGPVPITAGPVHEALVAAMTVPGLYAPVARDSQRLVDAVVLTPVPTEAVAGADVTVAVNLLGRETLPAWPGKGPPARPSGRPEGAARDTVVESLELAQVGASARQTALADVPITPRFGPGTWRHFHLADYYMAAGAEAAAAALPELRALARPQTPPQG